MLRGYYAPTDWKSIDKGVGIPKEIKLATIAASPVSVSPIQNAHKVTLPYVDGLSYVLRRPADEAPILHLERCNVGDEELYGAGIGTRLLQAAIRHGLELEPRITEFSGQWARLGMLNTIIGLVGQDNVATELDGVVYGLGSGRKLVEMFDAVPFVDGNVYTVDRLRAQINPDTALTWELPQAA